MIKIRMINARAFLKICNWCTFFMLLINIIPVSYFILISWNIYLANFFFHALPHRKGQLEVSFVNPLGCLFPEQAQAQLPPETQGGHHTRGCFYNLSCHLVFFFGGVFAFLKSSCKWYLINCLCLVELCNKPQMKSCDLSLRSVWLLRERKRSEIWGRKRKRKMWVLPF